MEHRIKLAYCVATPELRVDESVTAYQGDMNRAFQRLRELGYDGAELMTKDPNRFDGEMVHRLADKYGIEIPVLCTGEVYGQDLLSFMDPDMSIRREAIRRTEQIIDLASSFGAKVNIGRLRGRFSREIPRERSLQWMYSAFEEVTDYAATRGVTMILEPVARIACNNINSTQDGIETVRRVGRDNFRLMLDVFHMNLEDKSMEESFDRAKSYLAHIHLCDSNRLAPGRGNLDFNKIMAAIKRIDYHGYVSAEITQFPTQDTALEETVKVLRPLL
ncbi:MAG: sugar phosphate isomerase/epimerase [Deltaproteobacteria bacterium]|nr:sugar phosphate isomerase/epimerase [Deltaproteobacteria bacterium]MBW2123129.1 sugar phosphate isomerase/epimerase [Deltaproteobacteria bacterium]